MPVAEPAVPRPAATVLLLRDAPHPTGDRPPLQVFLQRRSTGMAFAGGMTVFPGGGVHQDDRPDPALWAGPAPERWAQRLGCAPALAGALVHAAVRETFEECGVLLAAAADGGVLPDVETRSEERRALVARSRTFGQVLSDHGLVLRADLLQPWARWVTPEESPRRYDTAFFVAVVPDGQDADAHTTEAVEAAWWYPDEALDRWQAGDLQLMAPTFRSLQQLAEHAAAADVLEAARDRVVEPVVPRVRREGDKIVVVHPSDPDFDFAVGHLSPLEKP